VARGEAGVSAPAIERRGHAPSMCVIVLTGTPRDRPKSV
jgi:hypothetical protein